MDYIDELGVRYELLSNDPLDGVCPDGHQSLRKVTIAYYYTEHDWVMPDLLAQTMCTECHKAVFVEEYD